MERADSAEFALLIEAMAAAFGREADEATITGYWMGLEDMDIADVRKAMGRAVRENTHMPRPAELRRGAGQIGPGERAVIAFGVVSRAVRECGHRASVDFDDPVVNATVRNLGGWSRVCALPSEEFEKWFRKDFERSYTAICAGGISEEAARYLVGVDEAENVGRFPEHVPPVRKISTGLPPHGPGLLKAPGLRLVSDIVKKIGDGT